MKMGMCNHAMDRSEAEFNYLSLAKRSSNGIGSRTYSLGNWVAKVTYSWKDSARHEVQVSESLSSMP
jgi:hypothetical protein